MRVLLSVFFLSTVMILIAACDIEEGLDDGAHAYDQGVISTAEEESGMEEEQANEEKVPYIAPFPDTTGINGPIYALLVDQRNGDLYVGGSFTKAGTVSVYNIAKWNGQSWSGLGTGTSYPGSVRALAMDSVGNLYVGGNFNYMNGVYVGGVARWNGATWSGLGNCASGLCGILGLSSPSDSGNIAYALAVDKNDHLYVGGNFGTAYNSYGDRVMNVNNITKWDGSKWHRMANGLGTPLASGVHSLVVDNYNNLYAGGVFYTSGGVQMNHVAKWNGTVWSALNGGVTGANDGGWIMVNSLALDRSGNIVAGGLFKRAGGVSVNNIAKWNGSAWSAYGTGLNAWIYEVFVDRGTSLLFPHLLYVGSDLQVAPGPKITKWTGSAWAPVDEGLPWNADVTAMAIYGRKLYIGVSGEYFTGNHLKYHQVPLYSYY